MTTVFEAINNVFRNSSSQLAEAVTFKLNSSSNGVIIHVNFFNEASESAMGEISVTKKEPTAYCNTADVVGATHASRIIRDNVTYYVVKIDPDDDGETVLYLSKNQIV